MPHPLSPGVARFAVERVSLPIMSALHRLTAPIPFPVAEPLALVLAALLTSLLVASIKDHRRLRTAAWVVLIPAALLALTWVPPLCLPGDPVPAPGGDQLTWLCGDLVGQLSASPLAFPDPADALRLAPSVADVPGGAVKAARYPEWMAACRIWGLFVPVTGEALVSADAPAPLLPFTAVHELMHLRGIAGEGAANVSAWERCLAAGGPFADSARLWALRYAMGLLSREDPAAWGEMAKKMEGPLLQTFLDCGGEADPARDDYAALVAYLAQGR